MQKIFAETGGNDDSSNNCDCIISDKIINDKLNELFTEYSNQIIHQFTEQGKKEYIFKISFDFALCSQQNKIDEYINRLETIVSLKIPLHWNLIYSTDKASKKEQTNFIHYYLLRIKVKEDDFIELRIAVAGNVDAGKSTLLGVLSHDLLDDGRGSARQKIFRHAHEMQTGRTSSVTHDIMGFDKDSKIVSTYNTQNNRVDWRLICTLSTKVVVFIDLAGHEKYLRTTIFGLTGHLPDYVMLVVGANMGFIGMTKEHLGLSVALKIPVMIVVTKIDMCPKDKHMETLNIINKILKSPSCRKIPFYIQNKYDVITAAISFSSHRFCPIFQVSNVTGQQIDLLKTFLSIISVNNKFDQTKDPIYLIDDLFTVPGVGTVVAGTMLQGSLKLDDKSVVYGPDYSGHFHPTIIKSIQRKRMPTNMVKAGNTCSISIKKVMKSELRKGMILSLKSCVPTCCMEFKAHIRILHHPTTISLNYQAMVHVRNVRQTCKIIDMEASNLRTGDESIITLQFIRNPEIVLPGSPLIFREGRTKAVGTVIFIQPFNQPPVTLNQTSATNINIEKLVGNLSINDKKDIRKSNNLKMLNRPHKNR